MTIAISSNNLLPATQSVSQDEVLQARPELNGVQQRSAKAKGQKATEDGDFALQLSQLGMVISPRSEVAPAMPEKGLAAAAVQKEGHSGAQQIQSAQPSEAGSTEGAMPRIRAPKMQVSQSMADKAPVSQVPAASLNTATAIAGLKPWSKDWVFTGNEQEIPNLKGLLEKPQGADPIKAASSNPAKALRNQTRGDAEAAINPAEEFMLDPSAEIAVAGMNSEEAAPARSMERPGRVNAALSGDDFLQTMNAVNPVSVNSSAGQNAGGFGLDDSESGGQDAEMGGQGAAAAGPSRGKRPEFKVIQGGAKSGMPRVEESWVAPNPLVSERGFSAHVPPAPTEISGHVVKGAMARDRLSSESLLGVSTGIRNLTPMGGGEIRVRLKPDNLGEVQVRVVAHGNTVGVHFRASDERARQILEESMSHLKESLASQNLNVSRIDVSLAHQTMGHEQRGDSGAQQQQASNLPYYDYAGGQQQNSGQWNQGQSNSGWDRLENWEAAPRGGSYLRPAASALSGVNQAGSRGSMISDGRLDVRA